MTDRVERAFQEFVSMAKTQGEIPDWQINEFRMLFFSGVHWMAHKLPASVEMSDPPTEEDLARSFATMVEVRDELNDHIAGLLDTVGTA